jgi:hypothetical protein
MNHIGCRAVLLWSALFLLGCSPAVLAEDRALIIGINRYQSPEIRRLYGTHNDVAAFHALLTARLGFQDHQIRELKDQEATREGILNAIDQWLIQDSAPGDRVVFYYSGHGDQIDDEPDGDEQGDHRDEALIAYDAVRDGRNWVLDDDIDSRFQRLQDREVLAVFDSCHSGTVTRDAFGDEDAKTPGWDAEKTATRAGAFDPAHQQEGGFIQGGVNLTAFFAVAPEQKALEDKNNPNGAHGVFTSAFVEGVSGGADANGDREVSYSELFDYLRTRSRQYCEDDPKNRSKCVLGLTPIKQYDESRAAMNFLEFGKSAFVDNTPPTEAIALADPSTFSRPAKPNSRPSTAATAPVASPAPSKPAKPKPNSRPAPAHARPPNAASVAEAALAHGNEAGLQLRIDPDNHVRLGQTVRYRVHIPHTGKLVLFDIDAEGKATLLYPNEAIPSNASPPCRPLPEVVDGGANILIPDNCMGFEIKAQEPTGKGKVVAVLIEDLSINTQDLLTAHRGLGRITKTPEPSPPFQDIPQPMDWMGLLRARLDQIFHEPDGRNREVRWSVTTVDYEIVR